MKTTSRLADRRREVRGEGEPLARSTFFVDELIEARLVDGDFPGTEAGDLLLVDVDADDVVAGVGEAGAGDQADVPSTHHGDTHAG